MSNKVLLKKSSVGAKVPQATDLDYGEVALNYADGKLYFKNSSNTIQPLGIAYTKVTSNTTAQINQGYIANTSAGAFTLTLPASPQTGNYVIVADDSNFNTNNLYIARNGQTIAGIAQDLTLDIQGIQATLMYDGSTWNVYTQVGATGGTAGSGVDLSSYVTLSGTQTLTNKTLTDPTVNLSYAGSGVATNLTISSGLATAFKTRIGTTANNQYSWTTNLYYDGSSWQKDDTTRGGWRQNQVALTTDSGSEFTLTYAAVGSTSVSNKLRITGSGAVTINNAYTLPTADGSNGQVLITNGSGSVSWGSAIDSTVVTLNGTQTLTNKTLTSPTINGATLSGTLSGDHTYSGIVTLNYTGAGSTSTLNIAGYNSKGGTGYHDFLKITNGYGSATNPNKWFRLDNSGSLQIINSAYTTNIFNLDDNGNLTISGNLTMVNRPAFRVTGAGTTNINATNTLTSSNFAVDFQQGSSLNTSTGIFTAPIAGLYQVNLIARYAGSANMSAIQVQKTSSGTTTQVVYLEWAGNSTANHMGGSSVVKLAVNDTLKVVVTAGTVTFDGNDCWSVAYIG